MPIPSAPFNTADSLVNGLSYFQFKPNNASKTGTTIALSTGVATATAHGLKVNQQIIFTSITGGTGITANTQIYWVLTAPTADTFTFGTTRGGTLVAPSVAATAFTVIPVYVFELAKLTCKGSVETKNLKRPNSAGVLFKVREWQSEGSEEITSEIDDLKRLLPMFNGSLRGYLNGTASVWVTDITDTATKCALSTEADFPCTAMTDGDIVFGGGEASKGTLKFTSNKLGFISWIADATV